MTALLEKFRDEIHSTPRWIIGSLQKYSNELVFLFACFPFLFPTPIYSDLQPWATILATLIIACGLLLGLSRNNINLRIDHISTFVLAFLPLIYFTLISIYHDEIIVRALYPWFSFGVFILSGLKIRSSFVTRAIPWILGIWTCVAIIQKFVYRWFLNFLVLRMHSSHDRGVTSLAVEPSIYANHILMMVALYFIAKPRSEKITLRDQIVALLAIVQIFYFAQALSTVMFGGVLLLLLVLVLLRSKWLVVGLLCAGLCLSQFRGSFDLGRMGALATILRKNPNSLIQKDASVQERAAYLFYPLKIFWYELPGAFGIDPSDQNLSRLRFIYQEPQNFGSHFVSSRISSGWGTLLFQLGIVGVLWAFFWLALALTQTSILAIFSAIGLFTLMWSSVPWASPLVGITFSFLTRGSFVQLTKQKTEVI